MNKTYYTLKKNGKFDKEILSLGNTLKKSDNGKYAIVGYVWEPDKNGEIKCEEGYAVYKCETEPIYNEDNMYDLGDDKLNNYERQLYKMERSYFDSKGIDKIKGGIIYYKDGCVENKNRKE